MVPVMCKREQVKERAEENKEFRAGQNGKIVMRMLIKEWQIPVDCIFINSYL